MGCSTCGKKYPRSRGNNLALTSNTRMSEVSTILTREQKSRSRRGVIKSMKNSSPSKGMIQPDTEAAIPGTKPDCGPIIPATGQPEAWVTKGTTGDTYSEKLESPMNTTLTSDNRAQGKVDE